MQPSFPYWRILTTGVFHVVFGFVIFVTSCVGLNSRYITLGISDAFFNIGEQYHNQGFLFPLQLTKHFFSGIISCSVWIMVVGVLGILTGIKFKNFKTTQGLKTAYMTTAIFSAVSTTLIAFGLSICISLQYSLHAIGIVSAIFSFADFVSSIVSASICCCCANSNSPGHRIVLNTNPIGPYPPGTHLTGSYPPGTYPAGSYPPGAYPAGSYPLGANPAGHYPPGANPAGHYPPGHYPPGHYPASGQFLAPQAGDTNLGQHQNPNPVENPTNLA